MQLQRPVLEIILALGPRCANNLAEGEILPVLPTHSMFAGRFRTVFHNGGPSGLTEGFAAKRDADLAKHHFKLEATQGIGLGVRNNQAKQFQQAEQHSGLGLVGTDLTYPHFYKTLRHPTGTTYRRGNS